LFKPAEYMTDTVHSFFRPERTLINAFGIILLTTLFYFFGAMLRLIDELSVFWPLNAVMAGVFAHYLGYGLAGD